MEIFTCEQQQQQYKLKPQQCKKAISTYQPYHSNERQQEVGCLNIKRDQLLQQKQQQQQQQQQQQ